MQKEEWVVNHMTDLDKEEKKALASLKNLSNRVKADHSFHKIKTLKDYFSSLGYDEKYVRETLNYRDDELSRLLTFKDVKDLLDDLRIALTTELWLKRNPPQLNHQEEPAVEEHQKKVITSPEEADKDYGIIKSPKESKDLNFYWFQKKFGKQLLDNIETKNLLGQYLIAKAGDGKTFMLGLLLRRLLDKNWHKENCISPWPIFVVTKANVVLQTEEVLRTKFGIDTVTEVLVVGVDQLRSRFGELFLVEKTVVEAGVEHIIWEWRPKIHPKLIVWDEAHLLKNTDSIQSKIGQSFGELEGVYQIFSSATPYVRVSEAKCFCVSTRLTIPIGPLKGRPLTNKNWSQFAQDVAYPAKPEDYNQEAVDRLTDIMDEHIVRVKGVKWQFNPINDYELIDFQTAEGREFYRSAEERFFRRKAKLEAGEISGNASRGYLLAIMTQYNVAAESNPDRAAIIAQRMYHDAQEGYAPVCVMKYKISISRVIKILMERFGVKRSQFSVIWGGSKIKITKKQKDKAILSANQDLLDALEDAGVNLESIGLSDDDVQVAENIEFDESLHLSTQNAAQTEQERKNFLAGRTTYCFYSVRKGGVGLSLHHTDDLTSFKCRRKSSGYAYEEDIPKVPTHPRRLYGPPCYSAIDVVQFLGRCARLTSLSSTRQTLLFFKHTIEERVAQIYSIKLKCLSKVVRNRESWEDVILGGSRKDREAAAIKYLQETGDYDYPLGGDDDEDSGHIVDTGSDGDE